MKKPDISIVLCTYNECEMLSKALDCMIQQESNGEFTFEIIVVDDQSTDQTTAILEKIANKLSATVRCTSAQGKGISHARNSGIAEARGSWIAFFDQDQLADPNWLRELFAIASKHGADVVEGPRDLLLSPQQLSGLGPVCRAMLGQRGVGKDPENRASRTCSCTGNVLISRRVFDTVGGFDESIIHGGEDWEFFGRVKAAGLGIYHAPRATVHHMIPQRRLTKLYFKWSSLRVGANFAKRDCRDWGISRTILAVVARIAQAFLVNVPLLLWASLTCQDVKKFDRRCLLWRAEGYTRETFSLILPRKLSQSSFSAGLEFRKERDILDRAGSVNLDRRMVSENR